MTNTTIFYPLSTSLKEQRDSLARTLVKLKEQLVTLCMKDALLPARRPIILAIIAENDKYDALTFKQNAELIDESTRKVIAIKNEGLPVLKVDRDIAGNINILIRIINSTKTAIADAIVELETEIQDIDKQLKISK